MMAIKVVSPSRPCAAISVVALHRAFQESAR
jgi:hypothetical protein